MSKTEDLIHLFSKTFETDNFYTRGEAQDFHCPFEAKCSVNKNLDPIWLS